jgi:predicted MPP superfamily phosphohydrolase
MLPERVRWLTRLALALAGALSIWLFTLNRVVIHWVDGPFKSFVGVMLAAGLGAWGIASTRGARSKRWNLRWAAVLLVFGAGEARRVWVRRSYGADSASTGDAVHLITTTDLTLRRFTLEVPGLPSRLRVVHLSDLHITAALAPYFDRVAAEMGTVTPDIIVMTGDYVSRAERIPLLAHWLEGLPKSRYGAFAVFGNHDFWAGHPDEERAAFERAGVHMIGGTCTDIEVSNGAALRLCGTEEPWGQGYPAQLHGDPKVVATLVLSHTPDNVYKLADAGATAVFAGHTHGGQFRLPIIGALVVPSRYGRRFDRGHFVVGNTHLFVSAGVGADSPPLRLFCPPDLVVVDLIGTTG